MPQTKQKKRETQTYRQIIASLFLIASSWGSTSYAGADVQREMIDITSSVFSIMDTFYAPKDWKAQLLNWEARAERDAIVSVILEEDITVKELHRLLLISLKKAHDYHLALVINSKESASLNFRVKPVEGRYFVVATNEKTSLLIQVGDELVKFNDKPVKETIDKILMNSGNPGSATEQMLATFALTKRMARAGEKVPQGPVSVTIKKSNSPRAMKLNLSWEYTPDAIDFSNITKSKRLKLAQVMDDERENPFYRSVADKLMLSYPALLFSDEESSSADESRSNSHSIGAKKSFLPEMGEILEENFTRSPEFYNYIFSHKGKKIGYVRISSYSPSMPSKASKEFQNIINDFEEKTDLLVIDQVHNPGGSVAYLYALVSMLSPKPLKTPLHKIAITLKDIVGIEEFIEVLSKIKTDEEAQLFYDGKKEIRGLPVNLALVKGMLKQAEDTLVTWNAGEKLTIPTPLIVDTIAPSKNGVYTKDIILLVDELDFSGGDFFPAILQDNQRVTVFGNQTAGAGGYINNSLVTINRMGITKLHYTGSIAYRNFNRQPIENLGITPDVKYNMTASDYQNNFEGYKKALLNLVTQKLELE